MIFINTTTKLFNIEIQCSNDVEIDKSINADDYLTRSASDFDYSNAHATFFHLIEYSSYYSPLRYFVCGQNTLNDAIEDLKEKVITEESLEKRKRILIEEKARYMHTANANNITTPNKRFHDIFYPWLESQEIFDNYYDGISSIKYMRRYNDKKSIINYTRNTIIESSLVHYKGDDDGIFARRYYGSKIIELSKFILKNYLDIYIAEIVKLLEPLAEIPVTLENPTVHEITEITIEQKVNRTKTINQTIVIPKEKKEA